MHRLVRTKLLNFQTKNSKWFHVTLHPFHPVNITSPATSLGKTGPFLRTAALANQIALSRIPQPERVREAKSGISSSSRTAFSGGGRS